MDFPSSSLWSFVGRSWSQFFSRNLTFWWNSALQAGANEHHWRSVNPSRFSNFIGNSWYNADNNKINMKFYGYKEKTTGTIRQNVSWLLACELMTALQWTKYHEEDHQDCNYLKIWKHTLYHYNTLWQMYNIWLQRQRNYKRIEGYKKVIWFLPNRSNQWDVLR